MKRKFSVTYAPQALYVVSFVFHYFWRQGRKLKLQRDFGKQLLKYHFIFFGHLAYEIEFIRKMYRELFYCSTTSIVRNRLQQNFDLQDLIFLLLTYCAYNYRNRLEAHVFFCLRLVSVLSYFISPSSWLSWFLVLLLGAFEYHWCAYDFGVLDFCEFFSWYKKNV